ncbi:hypothetical protein ACWD4G_33580 [Streptomyces sp. NPDC002643]
MSDQGAGDGPMDGVAPRSRLSDYVEMASRQEKSPPAVATVPEETAALPYGAAAAPPEGRPTPSDATPPETTPPQSTPPETTPEEAALIRRRRREGAAVLGEFRRTAVLLPLGEDGSPLTVDFGGIRWILAFSDEVALARFAIARGEGSREWSYERVLGARLLDVAIPVMAVAAGAVPYGVALDAGGPEGEGALFPPVRGIVPDAAAVDVDADVDAESVDVNAESVR